MPDLPSGTVTFLFTDIEGSTALWERDRRAMAAVVERRIALLDAVTGLAGVALGHGQSLQAARLLGAVEAARTAASQETGSVTSSG